MGNIPCTESSGDIKGDEESGWLFNVFAFCDKKTRSNCLFLTQRYYQVLTTDSSFRWRLERLHIEHGIYFPSLETEDTSWRSIFLELDRKRNLWEVDPLDLNCQSSGSDRSDRYQISVFARFKPLSISRNLVPSGRKVCLPLHQRLALIRIDKCLQSNKDAIRILKEQGGWFKEKWDEIENASNEDAPRGDFIESTSDLLTSGIKMIDTKKSRVVIADTTKGLREFEFDGVIDENATQRDVYETSTRRLICDVLNGVSSTCLVYGQTGSGKSFTMFGVQEHRDLGSNFEGIVPRACSELMTAIAHRKEGLNLNIECSVSVSFVEIYGNEILDLLNKGRRCGHSKASAQRCVLDGNAEVPVKNVNDVMRLINTGESQRRKAATAMNDRSSRAHSVFIISLNQKCVDTGKIIRSKMFLADLGGCEQTKKSKLDAGRSQHVDVLKKSLVGGDIITELEVEQYQKIYSMGFVKSDRMREAVYINLGLMALKSCVEALSQQSPRVPYANSKLTMLLATGLGGNSKTVVIVCAAQEEEHSAETINAFKFGQACRQVTNTVRTQTDILGDLMKEIDDEIAACEERIKRNERWVVMEEKRSDCLAEKGTLEADGFGGMEVRKTTVLVGAEEDRQLLHKLMAKKAQLSGSTPETASSSSVSSGPNVGGSIGFGKAHAYGLGNKFSAEKEKENYRFNEMPSEAFVPDAVKRKKDGERPEKVAKVGRLAYSGISA